MTDKDLGAAAGDIFAKAFTLGYETGRRALFPATEPAEDSVGDPLQAWKDFLKPIGWYRTMALDFAAKHFGFPANPVFEDRYTAPDGGKWQWTDELQWELRCYPPAPAVPAEVETKAEYPRTDGDFTVLGPEIFTDASGEFICWKGVNYVRQPDPASSPVVPAPTETGPWETLAKVPASVPKVIDTVGREFWRGPHGWKPYYFNSGESHHAFAPFVAAEKR
ncbi:hypothetical protein [Rhodococcus qingshengii]|uniref:hypothetical protein n=1 Tax=Rhodococcus qingshengii TaxID=334542 RepID=UPI0022B46981|nr:hypothetical protein [Rhodococcus qingshengii]MCZ4613329.1 hypothetical protein [Rhodococcus qingshengii]